MNLKSKVNTSYSWSKIALIYGGVLLVWSLYRLLFKQSVWLEETLIKGIAFTLPILFFPLTTNKFFTTIGISTKNFFQSVYLGIGIGLLLGLSGQLGNFIRHQGIEFNSYGVSSGTIGAFLILSLITAFWEQLLFSGYFLTHISKRIKDEIVQVSLTGLLFSVIHLPALYFVQHMTLNQIILSAGLLFTLGVSCAILKLRQQNLIAPIMAHALWGVTIFLFR